MKVSWQTYEEVSAYLLNQCAEKFGLVSVEGKQHILGNQTGTKWEIDAKGIKEDNTGFMVIECRRHTTSRQNQENLAALAYKITDVGAEGGIIVSPLDLQSGAKKVASANNITHVQLDENSTIQNYFMKFFNELMLGFTSTAIASDFMVPELIRNCENCGGKFSVLKDEKQCPKCLN